MPEDEVSVNAKYHSSISVDEASRVLLPQIHACLSHPPLFKMCVTLLPMTLDAIIYSKPFAIETSNAVNDEDSLIIAYNSPFSSAVFTRLVVFLIKRVSSLGPLEHKTALALSRVFLNISKHAEGANILMKEGLLLSLCSNLNLLQVFQEASCTPSLFVSALFALLLCNIASYILHALAGGKERCGLERSRISLLWHGMCGRRE